MKREARNIHAFSGLGADETAFAKLVLSPHQLVYHPWPKEMPALSIMEYAEQVASTIKEEDPVLLGLSFGGIFAIEVAKHLQNAQVVLISSVSRRSEIPLYIRMAGRLKLYYLIPPILYITPNTFLLKAFGAKSPALQSWLVNIVKSSSVSFNKWAVRELLEWKNTVPPSQLLHIHGTQDHVLPLKKNMSVDTSLKGGHLIVLTHAKEISEVILKYVDESE